MSKNIDIPLSKEIAKKGVDKIMKLENEKTSIAKELLENHDTFKSFATQALDMFRREIKLKGIHIFILYGVIAVLVILLFLK